MAAVSERLDKILANQGYGTRRDVKRLLHDGAVMVNGKTVTDGGLHVDAQRDVITIDGEKIVLRTSVYLMMNKCVDVVCASRDGEHETVFDLLTSGYRTGICAQNLHPVGRLDIDTEGLLLLTTDGALTHRLISPKTHVSKTYLAYLRDNPGEKQRDAYIKAFAEGIHIEPEDNESGADCLPAELTWIDDTVFSGSVYAAAQLTIYEGKYHQVKRMFTALGNKVVYLKRISMGNLRLDPSLQPGQFRELTSDEISQLESAD